MRRRLSTLTLAIALCMPSWLSAQTESEPNDNTAQANAIALGTAMTGDIGGAPCASGTSNDWFVLTTTQDGTLSLNTNTTTSGGPGALRVHVYDPNGNLINYYDHGADGTPVNQTSTLACVGKGTYYFQLARLNSECYTYAFTVTLSTPVFADDTEDNDNSGQATALAHNTYAQGHLNFGYTGDNDDWYAFTTTVEGSSTFTTIAESEGGGAVRTHLYDGNGNLINYFDAGSGAVHDDDTTSFTYDCLGQGNYYLRLVSIGGCGHSYKLKFQSTGAVYANDLEPNNSAGQAFTNGALAPNTFTEGHINFTYYGDNSDWYFIQTPAEGTIRLTAIAERVPVANGNIRVHLLDGNGNLITYWDPVAGGSNTAVTTVVEYDCAGQGDYYLQVVSINGCGISYRLKYETLPAVYGNDAEPNNSSGEAFSNGPLAHNTFTEGHINFTYYGDNGDWYFIQPPAEGAMSITVIAERVPVANGNLRVHLHDGNGNLITYWDPLAGGGNTPTTSVLGYDCLGQGNYYLQVVSINGCGISYKLKYQTIPAVFGNDAEPNNSFGQALVLNPDSSSASGHINFTYYGDNDDFYRVVLPGAGNIAFDLEAENAAGGALRVHLKDGNGNLINYSDHTVGASHTPAGSAVAFNALGAGTYYLHLVSIGGCGISYRMNCNDADADGTCNFFDLCPGGPEPGTPCDDLSACTSGDVIQANCVCAGTFEDADGDGTCDANDGCPNDPDKIAAGQCGCGAPDTDTDADGTADCVDPCPALANLVNGDACDDGNPNTSGDVVTNCICAGTLANDCEGVPGGPAQPGTGCDDNDICTINDVYDVNCNCAGTFEDTDGDGTCDANDGCPTDPDKTSAGQCGCGTPDTDTDADGVADCVDACPELPGLTNGDACDDGNPNTSGDVVTNCICAGTLANDCEGTPGGPAQPGTPCDDDDACTINDLWDVNCNCAGTFEDTDGDTVCDANDGCPTDPDKIAAGVCGCGNPEPGTACDDGNAGTENDQIDANCQCVGTPLDVDCEGTPGGTALPGTACDDQNANTENDTWDNNCVCVGTPIWDCPDLHANIGDPCDDNQGDTENDVVDANCECHGTQVYDCPDLQANIGDDCDDGDNTTDNDVVDANCECHGTPEGPCSEDLLLAISLDGNPGEVTWTVWDDTENTVVESGGPYAAGQANTTVTEAFCVPVGCYHLEVSDSGNDGGSSYVLSDDSGRRIIDASMGSYSSTSEIGGPLAARSFCVPTWNNSVLANWCDRSAHDRQSPLYCNSQPGATGYTWWFFDPHGTYNRRVTTANPTIVPNSLYSFPIPNNLWLNMRVRPVMAGSNFGPACRIKMVPHGGQGGSRELLFDEATNATMSLYPNPNRDGLVTVYMEGVDVSDATMIDIDVYDMVGKRVFAERTVAAEGIVNHRMDLGRDTGAGLYMVNVTIDGKRYTQRLVIQ